MKITTIIAAALIAIGAMGCAHTPQAKHQTVFPKPQPETNSCAVVFPPGIYNAGMLRWEVSTVEFIKLPGMTQTTCITLYDIRDKVGSNDFLVVSDRNGVTMQSVSRPTR